MTEEERIFRGELFASEEPELVEKYEAAYCRFRQMYPALKGVFREL